MPYKQPSVKNVDSPDALNRKVLVAVEVFDPVAQSMVSSGLTVKAKGLEGEPLLSLSGRFVWLDEGGKWPEEISIVPYRLPFAAETVVPPLPVDLQNIALAERLVRITLRPTAAYNLSEGITAIRGQLREGLDPNSPAVTDARFQLAWHDVHSGQWFPQPPPSVQDVTTDSKGEFGVFLRLTPMPMQVPDIEAGLLKVRLEVARGGIVRATPEDFPFLMNPAGKGRVSEGQLLKRDLRLSWADLPAI